MYATAAARAPSCSPKTAAATWISCPATAFIIRAIITPKSSPRYRTSSPARVRRCCKATCRSWPENSPPSSAPAPADASRRSFSAAPEARASKPRLNSRAPVPGVMASFIAMAPSTDSPVEGAIAINEAITPGTGAREFNRGFDALASGAAEKDLREATAGAGTELGGEFSGQLRHVALQHGRTRAGELVLQRGDDFGV